MRRFRAMFLLELKKVILVPWVLIFAIAFPQFLFVMQMENLKKSAASSFDPLVLIPSLTVLTILMLCLTTLPIGFARDRECKYFKRLRLAGASPSLYMIVHYTIQFILGIFTMGVLSIIAVVRYNVNIPYGYLPKFFGVLLVLHIMLYFLGVIIGNTSSDVRAVQTRGLIIYFILLFLGDITCPLSNLSSSIQKVAWFLPTTYGVELLRKILAGGALFATSYIFVILACLAVFGVMANRLFRWE
ncbi:ABC transporter permease [Clostridium manihotivorum]|uniref:ABC-2 type transporter transmembrane domain-containing protein n=1 Tax=Clostridium manihotivorum TaxID=2320868 RepID=A0A410DQ18_9CLOT|nr:ABC transporter permease [Clostridium manihotivorum]QAA31126.1 hypothetical protein C1I91_05295 [Clostridium manihotivorum]